MKKETVNKFLICICFIICMMPNVLNAQSKKPLNMPLYDEEPYHFGLTIGYNQMMFSINYRDGYQDIPHDPSELPDNIPGISDIYTSSDFKVYDINTQIGHGFTVGIVGNLRLARHFDFRFTPSLSFGNRHITYTLISLQEDPIEGVKNEKNFPDVIKSDTHSTFVELPLHIKYKSKRNYNYYTVKSYEEAKKLAYNIWSYHDTFCYIIDEVVEKKNVLKIKFFLPCIDCDDEGNFAEEGFYIYEIFKIKLRYNKGIKREPLLDLGE